MSRHRGFTLVELLVVIAIIAVLTSVLVPSLGKARESALRIKCAANLQQWGVALADYKIDNKGELPRSWGPIFSGVYPYTYRVRTAGPDATLPVANAPCTLSLEMMRPYLRGVPSDVNTAPSSMRKMTGVWRCPAAGEDLDVTNTSQWDTLGWVYGDYSYYSRTDLWTPANGYRSDVMSNPEDLIRNKASADRICMTDVLFRWSFGGGWYFNHRLRGLGAEFHGYANASGPPQLSGLNELFGDGHVIWKQRAQFNTTLMDTVTPGPGSRIVFGGLTDASFY